MTTQHSLSEKLNIDPSQSPMHTERIAFPNASAHTLSGRLDTPDGKVLAQALFAHCFACGKDSLAAHRVSRALAKRGIAVLRFDFTGLGDSGGDFASTNFSSNLADLAAAAGYLRDIGRPVSLLVGHSLGGAAVLAAAGRLPEVRAVATIAAPSDPAHVAGLFGEPESATGNSDTFEVRLGGRAIRLGRQFLIDAAQHRLLREVSALRRALLVLHSPVDKVVDITHATRIVASADHPKSFVALDGADHLLSNRRDAAYASEVIAAWSTRYLRSGPKISR